jgi:hypothetical protein
MTARSKQVPPDFSLDAPTIWQKVAMVLALPMRRELIRPWFRMVARTGGAGAEESFLDPDPKDHSIDEVLCATRDGELFLFVNDAVLGVPGLEGVFYSNNVGTADVTITRVRARLIMAWERSMPR